MVIFQFAMLNYQRIIGANHWSKLQPSSTIWLQNLFSTNMYQRTYERLDEHPVSYIIGACQATGGFDVGVQLCCAPSRYCWFLLSSLDPNCSLEMFIVFFLAWGHCHVKVWWPWWLAHFAARNLFVWNNHIDQLESMFVSKWFPTWNLQKTEDMSHLATYIA